MKTVDWTFLAVIFLASLSILLLDSPAPARERTQADRIAVLEAQVATLNAEVADLKAANKQHFSTDGCIKEYFVDSTAGKIRCQSCVFEDEK